MDYLLKGIFYTGQNRVKTIPKAIHFWALKTIDQDFLNEMKEVILSIKRMDKIEERISLGFVEFDPKDVYMEDLEKFLFNSKSKIYLIEHTEFVEHDIRDLYEQFYRTQFFDVMFISIDPNGDRVQAWVHTPFLMRKVDI